LRGAGVSLTRGLADGAADAPISLVISGAERTLNSEDRRLTAGFARARRPSVHAALLNPQVRQAEETVVPAVRGVLRRGRRLAKGALRRGRVLAARR
jgi:hypothetical protein